MPQVPRNRKNRNKRKDQTGNLAGAVAQNLRDRRHHLSRLSKRQDVQSCAVAPLSVQQPTGVIRMRIVHILKTMFPACEKSFLFRHTLLLPKIIHSYPARSTVSQSITMSAPATGYYRYKRGNNALHSPDCRWKNQRSDD